MNTPHDRPPDAVPGAAAGHVSASSRPIERARAAVTSLAGVRPERIDWLWPGYLARGKLHVIDGDPGLGKSTLTLDLAARASTGAEWPDGQTGGAPTGVVLLSAEDGLADTIRPRLDAAGADLDRVAALTGIDYPDPGRPGQTATRLPALPDDVDLIAEAIHGVGAGFVVIDPLMAFLGASINAHRDQDVRRALSPLMKVAEATACAVVLVRHLTKGESSNALYRGSGSIGIIGAARLGLAVARDPRNADRVIVAPNKANITALSPAIAYRLTDAPEHGCARVEWDGVVEITADELLGGPPPPPDPAVTWLTGYLDDRGGTAPCSEVITAATAAGIAERSLYRARDRARIISERDGFPARAVWRLPDTGTDGRTGRTGRTGPDQAVRTANVGRTDTAGGRTDGATDPAAVLPLDLGPCARCGRPARRYGPRSEGTLCRRCKEGRSA